VEADCSLYSLQINKKMTKGIIPWMTVVCGFKGKRHWRIPRHKRQMNDAGDDASHHAATSKELPTPPSQ
jgi:hypothetical protein